MGKRGSERTFNVGCLVIILIIGGLFVLGQCGTSTDDLPNNRENSVANTPPVGRSPVPVDTGEPPDPPCQYPSVRSVLAVLCEGDGLLDSGKYSRDQQEVLFNRDYKDKTYLVSGKIADVGTSSLLTPKKHISVMMKGGGHYFDVCPSADFDLLDYTKGTYVSFIGKWTRFGTGIVISHLIEDAVQISPSASSAARVSTQMEPQPPSDQASYVQQCREMRRLYDEANRSKNDLRVNDVVEQAKPLFGQRQVAGWIGKVVSVNDSLGSKWVEVTADGIQYNLWPNEKGLLEGNDALPVFHDLTRGQWVRFTGEITGSMRLTSWGAITDPAMKVTPTSIEVIQQQ